MPLFWNVGIPGLCIPLTLVNYGYGYGCGYGYGSGHGYGDGSGYGSGYGFGAGRLVKMTVVTQNSPKLTEQSLLGN